jgi:serine/threonine protein kinase
VLISDTETAILCDFGLSRMKIEVTTRTTVQEAAVIIGSRNWMAPERLMGRLLKPPADIYAFGMTIYEVGTCICSLLSVADVFPSSILVRHR